MSANGHNVAASSSALMDLTGKVALVTGGGTGIGLMIARGFAKHGARVYISGRRLEPLKKASESYFDGQGELLPLQLDVTDKASITAAVDYISKEDGKLDILVNNAGTVGPVATFVAKPSPYEAESCSAYGNALFDMQTFADWDAVNQTNVSSVFFVTAAFLGLLEASTKGLEGGLASVINISSVVAKMNFFSGTYAYNSSKAGTSHLTQLLATDFALKGFPIRVNAISPGLHASNLTASEDELIEYAKSAMPILHQIPMKRAGREEEMAALAVYLASPASAYVTGQEIQLDGGMALVNP